MEKLAVDSPAPYRDVSRHALVVEHGGHAFRRGVDLFAALIKPPQNRLAHRLEPGHAIIAKIGLEPRMDGGDRRDVVALDRTSTRLNSSHYCASRMPSSALQKTTIHLHTNQK